MRRNLLALVALGLLVVASTNASAIGGPPRDTLVVVNPGDPTGEIGETQVDAPCLGKLCGHAGVPQVVADVNCDPGCSFLWHGFGDVTLRLEDDVGGVCDLVWPSNVDCALHPSILRVTLTALTPGSESIVEFRAG